MATIRELTSPNGWPASEDRQAIGIQSFVVPGTKLKIACAKAVAPILVAFCKEFHELVEPIDQGQLDDWGYAFRMTRGSDKVLSNHSSGTAVDLNALKHPLGKSNTFNKEQCNIITSCSSPSSRNCPSKMVVAWAPSVIPPNFYV